MNSSSSSVRRCLALLVLAATASLARAQVNLNAKLPTEAAPHAREGLLGESYLAFDAAATDQRNGPGRIYGVNFGANLAVTENTDLTFSFPVARQREWPDDGWIYQFGADWTGHLRFGRVKPFVVGGVAYQLTRTPAGEDLGLWDLGGGVEVLVARGASVTLKAVNVGSFSKGISNPWQYTAGGNYWFNRNWAATASVTFIEDQATAYTLGVRWGF